MSRAEAEAFLEQLQRATFESWQLTPHAFDPKEQTEFIERFLAARYPGQSPEEQAKLAADIDASMKANHTKVPTPYEEPGWYSVMTKLAEQVREAAQEAEFAISTEPLLGTLPTGRINAMTVLVPGTGSHLVLFEWQLFIFALLFSKAVVRAMPMGQKSEGNWSFLVGDDAVRQRISEDPSVSGRFTELVTAYAVTGLPGQASQYLPEPQYAAASDILRNSLELFVMAHEYAHVGLDHLSDAARAEAAALDGAEAVEYSWQQEYSADIYGVVLMMLAMRRHLKVDAALSYWGADLFFSAIDVMERAVSILRTGTEATRPSATHPPSKDRRELLRAALPRIVGDENAESAIGLGRQVEFITERLWERAREELLSLHRQGVRPAAWWLS